MLYRRRFCIFIVFLLVIHIFSGHLLANASDNVTIIQIDRTRNRESIVMKAKELKHSGFDVDKNTKFAAVPNYTAPYAAGSLDVNDITDALNTVKMIRYIAGLPYENIKFSDELNKIAQHGAVLMSATGQFTHEPAKPSDMSEDFFDLAYKGCRESNIYYRLGNISNAVLGFAADSGAANIEKAGHRRWILKPGAANFGIGYASKDNGIDTDYISMHVFDGLGPYTCESDSYIAWPNSGDFPIQYFIGSTDLGNSPPYPWSINLGAPYADPDINNITLKLTRIRDNKVWTFDKNTPNLGITGLKDDSMHLSVDNMGYGITKAIIFRPDVSSLGPIKEGDTFKVELSGINHADGSAASLNYDIRFFDLEKEILQNNPTENISPTPSVDYDITIIDIPGEKPALTDKVFPDVPDNHWAANVIYVLADKDIISGFPNGMFMPDEMITRGQFAKILTMVFGKYDENATLRTASGIDLFTDVQEGQWFYPHIASLARENLTNGRPDGTFGPNDSMTREEAAKFIGSAVEKYKEIEIPSNEESDIILNEKNFNDIHKISVWSKKHIAFFVKKGIIKGYAEDNTFKPANNIKRSEACMILKMSLDL